MPRQSDSGGFFGSTLAIRRRSVEIVYAVSECIVDELVDAILVDDFIVFVVGVGLGWPTHTAVAEQRNTVAAIARAVGHLVDGHVAVRCGSAYDLFRRITTADKRSSRCCAYDGKLFEKIAS